MDQLEQASRAFLAQRNAPVTPSNLQSIRTFLQMNPDKLAEFSANSPRSLLPATDTASVPVDALDAAVIKSMQPREGNTNVAQQRALKKKTGLSTNVQGLDMQGVATDPPAQTANSTQATPGNVSDAPAATAVTSESGQQFVDPNNPPDPMAGVNNEPIIGDIGGVIEKLLGAGAVAGGAYLASRGKTAPVVAGGTRALPAPTTRALPAPSTRALPAPTTMYQGAPTEPAALPSPGRMVGTDPNLDDMQGKLNVQSVRQETAGRASPLKDQIKRRNRDKAKKDVKSR